MREQLILVYTFFVIYNFVFPFLIHLKNVQTKICVPLNLHFTVEFLTKGIERRRFFAQLLFCINLNGI